MHMPRFAAILFVLLAVVGVSGCEVRSLGSSTTSMRLNSTTVCETVELSDIFDRPEDHFGRCLRFRGPVVIGYHSNVAFVSPDPARRFDIVISSAIRMSDARRNGWREGMIAEATGVLVPLAPCWTVRPDGSHGCAPVSRPVQIEGGFITIVR